MKHFDQTIKHDPDNGQWGDCYRTALGCLLDMPPWAVPHFCDGADPDWAKARDLWLDDNLLMVVYLNITADTLDQVLEIADSYVPTGCHYILTGLSGRDVNHSVIALARTIVHNPAAHWHGGDDTLIGPCPETGSWEMEYIVGKPPMSVYNESPAE